MPRRADSILVVVLLTVVVILVTLAVTYTCMRPFKNDAHRAAQKPPVDRTRTPPPKVTPKPPKKTTTTPKKTTTTPKKLTHHEKIVRKVNQNGPWTAALNRFATIDNCANAKNVLGRDAEAFDAVLRWSKRAHSPIFPGIPSFDAREKWPHCRLLHEPTINQGGCGSCWAVASTAVIADRICVGSNGTHQPRISASDAICNVVDGDSKRCHGGDEWHVFSYWNKIGLVTGGLYGTTDGCRPYTISAICGGPCLLPKSESPKELNCTNECGLGYHRKYNNDKFFGGEVIKVDGWANSDGVVLRVKKALMDGGPVAGIIDVYEDFMHYRSGVYKHITGKKCYGHVIKIIGWGTEPSTVVPYWLFANSWGENWGENGFGKIALSSAGYFRFSNPDFDRGVPASIN